jgi:23S rRNA (uridine2552-2'-O)-methyltransferase
MGLNSFLQQCSEEKLEKEKMGKTRKGLRYEPQDTFYKEAKKRGFVARSALKLEELDRRFRFYKSGMKVLDIGCAPGSWLQYASSQVGAKGKLLGFDIAPVRVDLANVQTFVGDVNELSIKSEVFAEWGAFDVIQSDAMVKTSGIAESDCARSIALVEESLRLAKEGLLVKGGTFVAKVFEGPGFTEFYVAVKRIFSKTSVIRPEATRKGSREVYIVCLDFKRPNILPTKV